MANVLKLSTLALLAFSLVGCGSMDYLKNQEQAAKVGDKIESTTQTDSAQLDPGKVKFVDRAPVATTPVHYKKVIPWLNKHYVMNSRGMPLSFVLSQMLKGQGVQVKYGDEVDPNASVQLVQSGSIQSLLNTLTSQLDYSYVAEDDSVLIQHYVTQTFDLTALAGHTDFQIGSDATGGGDNSNNTGTTINTGMTEDNSQYAKLSMKSANIFKSIQEGIQGILKNGKERVGDVNVIPSSGSVIVRTTPAKMRMVESFIKQQNENLSRQVLLKVKVLQFTSNNSSEFGIDWNLVRTFSKGKISFNTQDLPSVDTDGSTSSVSGMTFQAAKGTRWEGSSILIKALQEQGKVSVATEPSIVALNNRVSAIDIADKIGYIAKTVVTPNENSDASVEVDPATVSDGTSMFVLPSIHPENVLLNVSTIISKFKGFSVTKVSGVDVKQPEVFQSKYNQAVNLSYGSTLILSGYSQSYNSGTATSQFKNPLLGGNAGLTTKMQIIVLITPYRV
ncbi:hypothetical protein [Dongshaea marina]|uniref:hypothetical protein n=1 Tax=Dongshaea marina TaxID=2047966 RepID=UPI000D3EBC91|nr:hypothetical protein [Dongshaea marina]